MAEQKQDEQHAEAQEQKQPPKPIPNPRKRPLPSSSASATLLRPFKSPLIRPPTTAAQSASTSKSTSTSSSSSTKSIDTSNASIDDLQKQHAALHSRLLSLRSELDTAQQALRIERSGRDNELRTLIDKWKRVSQDVAEELFPYARDRVERMGGMRVWRKREKERLRRVREEWVDDDDGGLNPNPDDNCEDGEEEEEDGEDEVSVFWSWEVDGWILIR